MKTSRHILHHDIPVFCKMAGSFPDGVLDAFRHIEKKNPEFCRRTFYGLSRGNRSGGIDYWAAVERRPSDEENGLALETKTISKGTYAAVTINDFRQNIQSIGLAFELLLQNSLLDESSYCVELYENDTVTCIVKLQD